jgi:hypothetical protein
VRDSRFARAAWRGLTDLQTAATSLQAGAQAAEADPPPVCAAGMRGSWLVSERGPELGVDLCLIWGVGTSDRPGLGH